MPGAEHAVILEEIGTGRQRLDFVDADQIEFRTLTQQDAQQSATDPAESVDGDANTVLRHGASGVTGQQG